MKFTLAFFISIVFAFHVVAQSEAEKTRIVANISSVMNQQAADWNKGDIEGFMRGYWKSEKLVFVSNEVTRGWQPTLDRYKRTYSSRDKMGQLAFSDLEITVLSTNAAVVLGSWSLAREKDNPNGKFTLIFRKLREGWRIVHDHTT